MNFDNALRNIPDVLKAELTALVNTAKADSAEFLARQGSELELTLMQLETGDISRAEFEVATRDIKRAAEIFAIDQKIAATAAARERAVKFAFGIGNLVLDQLIKQLKVPGTMPGARGITPGQPGF